MIEISDKAKQHLRAALEGRGSDEAVRIYVAEDGCAGGPLWDLTVDKMDKNDAILEEDGLRVAMNYDLFLRVGGVTVDYNDQGTHNEYVIIPEKTPEAGPACTGGCCGC